MSADDFPRTRLYPRAPVIANVGEGECRVYAARCIEDACGWIGPEFSALDDFEGMEESLRAVDAHSWAVHVDPREAERHGNG